MRAHEAYASVSTTTRNSNATEYAAVARITQALQRAASVKSNNFPQLAKALHDNRRMWTILAADCAQEANVLPGPLKARILYLAEFTYLHTGHVLAGRGSVAPLLDVNLAVLRGLKMQEARK